MFESKNVCVKEITSVILVKAKENEGRIIHYGDKIQRCELIYKLSGEVITHFNKKVYHIKPGEVYILPKTGNADYFIERIAPGDCIDIFFDTDASFGEDLLLFDFRDHMKVRNLFQKIYGLWLTKPEGYEWKGMSAVYEILYEMLLKKEQSAAKSKFKKLEPGIEYLHSHLYDTIDYKRPSEACGISYTYFKKLFIEKFGVPPIRYVTEMRLERSKELLLTKIYTVSEVAQMCGFESIYYFSKKFKEKYQCTPTAYKNSVQ